MAKRFIVAFFTFIGLIIPGAFALALLVSPARPAPLERPGCDRSLADALAHVTSLQARAVTALCKSGPERERELDRIDADVETINNAIAARCS